MSDEKKKPNEIYVRSFVEIADVLPEIPNEEFIEEFKKRLKADDIKREDIIGELTDEEAGNELSDDGIINEVKERDWSRAQISQMMAAFKEGYPDLFDTSVSPRVSHIFDSLQHQQLFEEFEEARKNINPSVLYDLFAKLNRPDINKKMMVLR